MAVDGTGQARLVVGTGAPRTCGEARSAALGLAMVWCWASAVPGPGPAAATLAAGAWSPPKPRIRTNPPPGRAQVAGLATWLWTEPPGPLRFATPDGLALEARATTTRFDLGDGATLTCAGTGVPYDPSRPETAQSSDCTHAWKATSAGQTLEARATVTWAVFFEGRPVATRTASSDLDLAVAEAQALDRRPDPMSGAEAAANAATDQANADSGGARPLGELGGLVPDKDGRNWLERGLGAVGDFLGKVPGWTWSGLKDLGAGIWDGVAGPLAMIWEFSNLRALLDWDGYMASWSAIRDAIRSDPGRFFKEMLKGLVGWQDFADGRPLKAIGSWIPSLALAFVTGGGSLAAKGAQGASKGVPAATRAARGLDEVADGAKVADDVARGAPRAPVVVTRAAAQKELRAALGPDPYRGVGQAHHIFEFSQHNLPLGQKLQDWGVKLNGADNGVWLPSQRVPGYEGALHRGANTAAYRNEVADRLSEATSYDDAVEILDDIRQDLLSGRMRLNSAE